MKRDSAVERAERRLVRLTLRWFRAKPYGYFYGDAKVVKRPELGRKLEDACDELIARRRGK